MKQGVRIIRHVVGLLIFFISCSVYSQTTEVCNDGKDNNGDGLIDCNDSLCIFPVTIEKGCRCFDNIDNDGDGKIDPADTDCASYYGLTFVGSGSTCSIQPPPGTGFSSIAAPQTSSQNTADTPAKVVVGDMNGDGVPDVAVTSKWNSTLQVVATKAFGGFTPGEIMSDFRTPGSKIFPKAGSNYVFEHEVLIADINKDNIGEVFAIASERGGSPNNAPVRYFLTGFTYKVKDLEPLFDAIDLGTDRPGNPGIADFDGDGKAEIYLKNRIYAAESGVLLANPGGNWDTEISSGPVAVNMFGDTKLELVCGNFIYSVPSLTARTLQALTVARDMNTLPGVPKYYPKGFFDLTEYGSDHASTSSTADFDGDGFIDVLLTGAINCSGLEASPCGNNTTTIFYWNVQKNTVQTYTPPDPAHPATGWTYGTGRINLGDATGDGKLDALFVAGNKMFCLGLDAGGSLVLQWIRTINDSLSGILSLTVYDFNNDGKPEVVYRDSQELVVVDGPTGQTKIWSASCQSHTWTEGPVVADVNGDGNTDICITCYTNAGVFDASVNTVQQQSLGQTRLYYSTTNAWLPTRKIWNQHPYYVTNINDNLTLPFPQVDPSLIFSTATCPNGLPGPQRPLNLFMNQVPRLSRDGCPEFPAPDLTFTGDTPSTGGIDTDGDGVYTPTVVVIPPICGDLAIKAYFNLINNGDLPISDNVPVSFFNGDPTVSPVAATLLYSTTLTITNLQVGQKLVTPTLTFNGPGTTFKLYIVIYNNGASLPIALTGQSTKECSIDNNLYSVDVIPDPFTATVEKIKDNFKCINSAPDNGELRAHIFKGVTEVLDYSPYAFQWYTGTGTTSPIPAPAGTAYNLLGRAEGTYTLVVTNTQKGCSSLPLSMTIARLGNDPDVVITVVSHQTKCSPANGELLASITTGNTGFVFEWFDVALTPLGIIGPQAAGLAAGSYVVRVSKDGCAKTSTPVTINGPQIPDASAQVLQHIVDCSNANSGSVQADAVFNGVIQDPANYTFNWYFYNNLTSTRGSILPAANGTGQIRTGLAAGYYQAEIKDNLTQCKSGVSPVVQVQTQTLIPTAQITQVAPQTSCDPANPNGILNADALISGVVQNPSTINFQWFKGQNTLPANLVATTSGTNGQTVNKVAGGGIPYTVKITTALNCSAIFDFTIAENLVYPVLSLTTLPNTVCDPLLGTSPYSGSVSASVTFAGSPVTTPDANYKFTWHNGAATTDPVIVVPDNKISTLSGLKEGDYAVVVERTDLKCASTPQTKPVVKATVLPDLSATSTGSNICDITLAPDGTATVVVNNAGADSFTYKWFAGATIAGAPLTTGVNSNNGNQATAVKLGGPTPPAPFTYTVLVTNQATGCQNNRSVLVADVSVVPVLSFISIVPNSICSPATDFNGSLTTQVDNIPALYTIADYTFKWYNGPTNASPVNGASTTTLLNKLDAGSYTVDAKNTKTGCQSVPYTNQVPDLKKYPAIQITSVGSNNCDATKTPDGTITATISNAVLGDTFSYSWSSVLPTTTVITAANNPTSATAIKLGGPTNAPNTYNVVVTNTATGCISNNNGVVADVSQKPTFTLTPVPNTICDIAVVGGPTAYTGHLDVTAVTHPVGGTISYEWFNVDALNVATANGAPNAAVLANRDNGKYGVKVSINELGCTSELVIENILDDLDPVDITPNIIASTNCAPAVTGNGTAEITAPLSGGGITYGYQWYNGSLVDSGQLMAGKTNPLLGNNIQGGVASNFVVEVINLSDGCKGNEPINVPDAKVIPTIDVSLVQNNTICVVTSTRPADGELLATVLKSGAAMTAGSFSIDWTPATGTQAGTDGVSYTQLVAGNYTANVTETGTGCTSTDDNETILNDFTFPDIQFAVTSQTSCDLTAPNGALVATDLIMTLSDLSFEWFTGIGTSSSLSVDGGDPENRIDDLVSDDYTVRVTVDATGCGSEASRLVGELITFPTILFSDVDPVTRCDNPDGSVQASITNTSANFTIFYMFTENGNPVPSNNAGIQAGATFTQPDLDPYINLEPGFVTAYVVNNTTTCESTLLTTQIQNMTADYDLDLVTFAAAGNCTDPGGGADVDISGGSGSYDYEWHQGTPNNTGINFFNNPPLFSGALVASTLGDKMGSLDVPADLSITTGVYTVVVTDQANGCGDFFTVNIPFVGSPTVNVTTDPVTLCDADNGGVQVEVNGTSTDGYRITFFSGTSPGLPGSEIEVPTQGPAPTLLGDIALQPVGEYYIEVRDLLAANFNCPLGFTAKIESNVLGPLLSINDIQPNTSCTPGTSSDGEIDLKVETAAGDTGLKNYFLTSITPVDPIGLPGGGTQIGNGSSGQLTGPLVGFKPKSDVPSYTFLVTDQVSHCFTELTVSFEDQQAIPSAISVLPVAETLCAPNSNGSATASIAVEPITEFDFNWYSDSNITGNSVLAGGLAVAGGAGGQLLNRTKVPVAANWPMGTTGLGSGDRIYYVQGIRNATASEGVGCPTELKQVVIPDEHLSPNLDLTSTFNTFCAALVAGAGDGAITLQADADGSTSVLDLANFTYVLDVDPNGINGTAPVTNAPNNVAIVVPNLGTNTYKITATRVTTGCQVINSIAVDDAPFFVSITNTSATNQLICLPNGQANVLEVTIDRTAAGLANLVQNSGLPLTNVYDFEWYPADPSNPNVFVNTPLEDGATTPINAQSLVTGTGAGQFPTMGVGTYYAKAVRKAGSGLAEGCPTFPARIDVKDEHKNPVVTLIPYSNTSCLPGSDEGQIEVQVTDATNPLASGYAALFNYDWAALIADTNGNNGNKLNDDPDPLSDLIVDLADAAYSVTVTNPSTGCSTLASTTIIKNATPVFVQSVVVTDQVLCAADGSILVTKVSLNDRSGANQDFVTGPVLPQGNITDFNFDWQRTGNPFVQTTTGAGGNVLNTVTYTNAGGFGTPMGAGTYTVTAIRNSGVPGAGCKSAPFQVVIQNKQIFPVVSLTPLANTSCDPSFFEGGIKVKVTDASVNLPAPLAGAPYVYNYNWTTSATPGFGGIIAGTHDGDQDGTDGDGDNPMGLREGSYLLEVRNTQTNCSSPGSTTIFKNSTPIFVANVTSLPQILCNPDGQLEVTRIEIKDRDGNQLVSGTDFPMNHFEFDWNREGIAFTQTTPGTILNVGNYDASPTGFNTPLGVDSYTVIARRIAGGPGTGCFSAPFKADIDDQRLYPTATFTSVTNSSCNVAMGNGSVTAMPTEQNGVSTGPYTFAWTLNGVALPTITNTVANALDGNYGMTTVNLSTGCPFTTNFNLALDQTKSTPNVIDVSTVDPTDCNPSASARVDKITLGSTTNSILLPGSNEITDPAVLASRFAYVWADGNSNPIPGQVSRSIGILLPGSYFVSVVDNTTTCKSGPKEVVINDDDIIYPVAEITQTAKQISCIATVGTAALTATGDGLSGGIYTFTWFPSLDNTGTPISPSSPSTPNIIDKLTAGDYSVTVLNTSTNCSSEALYVVPDDAPFYTPVVSVAGQPRTLCVGQDGAVIARVINLDPTYPFAFDYTSDLFFGSTPNLGGIPNVPDMAIVPGFPTNFIESNLAEGFYTVRVLDNNTGCFGVATGEVKDQRTPPVIVIEEDFPMTNCDPIIANGQLSATADKGQVGGYVFDWYRGATVSTPVGPLIVSNNKLIGQRAGTYVVRVTTTLTGCIADKSGVITDKTVIPHLPTALVISDRTNCITPNGSVTANVEGTTLNYTFNWYNGTAVKPAVDFSGIDYQNLDIGTYAVTATNQTTGCVSSPATAPVADKRVLPQFTFETVASYCSDTGKPRGIGSVQLNVTNPGDVFIDDVQWYDIGTNANVGSGVQVYELFPGFYRAEAITIEGCRNEGVAEIKTEISPYNGVSSNGDSQNDAFIVDCITNFPNNNVKIFNRSGIKVYEIDGYNNADRAFKGHGEEGIYISGQNLPVGTYFYVIDKRDGSKPVAGYLELDR